MTQETTPYQLVGLQYRNAKPSAFGAPSQITWIVQQAWVGADGIPYVRLVKENDFSEKKTLSAKILQDRHTFIPVQI